MSVLHFVTFFVWTHCILKSCFELVHSFALEHKQCLHDIVCLTALTHLFFAYKISHSLISVSLSDFYRSICLLSPASSQHFYHSVGPGLYWLPAPYWHSSKVRNMKKNKKKIDNKCCNKACSYSCQGVPITGQTYTIHTSTCKQCDRPELQSSEWDWKCHFSDKMSHLQVFSIFSLLHLFILKIWSHLILKIHFLILLLHPKLPQNLTFGNCSELEGSVWGLGLL